MAKTGDPDALFNTMEGAMDPIEVIVRRGTVVEAIHVVHAVVVRDGEVIEEAGEPGRVAHLRSSAKPFQAMPLLTSGNASCPRLPSVPPVRRSAVRRLSSW